MVWAAHLVGSRRRLWRETSSVSVARRARQRGAVCPRRAVTVCLPSRGGRLWWVLGRGPMCPASPPGGVSGVWRLQPGETCHSAEATPASLILPPFVLRAPFLCLHPVFSLPHPALCPVRCQKGPVSVPWQRQRPAAPAASAVSLDFVSGAQGLGRAGQGTAHTQGRLGSQASGRDAMGGAGPTPRGIT